MLIKSHIYSMTKIYYIGLLKIKKSVGRIFFLGNIKYS